MCDRSATLRALQFAAVGLTLSTAYELLEAALFPHVGGWQLRAATVLFVTFLTLFIGWRFFRREQRFLEWVRAGEEFGNTVIDNLPVIVCIVDADGSILRWNALLEAKLGYSNADISAIKILDTVAPEDRERVREAMDVTRIRPVELEASMLHSNGSRVPYYLTGSRIAFHGRSCLLGIAIDESAKKKAHAAVRLQAAALRAAANGIVITDRDGTIEWVNQAFTAITGFTANEAIGKTPRLLKSGEEDEALYQNLWSTISAGKVWRGEISNRRKDGTTYTEDMSITPVISEVGVITHYVAIKQDITDRLRSEERLRKSEERFSKAFRSSPVAITISTEEDGRYLDVNDAFLQVLGYNRERVIGYTASELNFWIEPSQRIDMVCQLRERGRVTGLRTQYRTATGQILEVDVSAERIEIEGQPCVLAITRDITETQRQEARFRQAQKMEAVGRLAGGVAHDFNNMLGVIIGYSDLSLALLDPGNRAIQYVEEIKTASNRAVSLTRQLMAFSRQQVVFPKTLDLNEVVRNVTNMLRRMIGENIALSFRPTDPIASISADSGQIEQILMNLIVNARDAMPGGGEIIIETGHAELDENHVSQHPGSHSGPHVVLSVSDSGCGMDENTKSKIFDPFFTTKQLGQGTGLGLSTVYGVVKQSGGTIFVYSEPGKGTTFKLYFPRVDGKAEQRVQLHQEAEFPAGSETILVVEDDEPLRALTVRLLRDAGYRVIETQDAEAALAILRTDETEIDLLLADVILPHMGGPELLEQAKAVRSVLRSMFMSGYTGDLVALRGLVPESAFLEKPFTRSSLLNKVHSALHDEPAKRTSS